MNPNQVNVSSPQHEIVTISESQNSISLHVNNHRDTATDIGNIGPNDFNREEDAYAMPDHLGTENSFKRANKDSPSNWITKDRNNSDDDYFIGIHKNYLEKCKASFNNTIYLLLVAIGCTLSFSVIALIPGHNIIKFSEYWYEPVFIWIGGYWPIYIYFSVLHCKYVLEYPDILWFRVLLYVVLPIVMITVVSHCLQYFIWGRYFGFYLPMPFMGLINVIFSNIMLIVGVWYQVPTHLRSNSIFRKRLRAFFAYWIWEQSIPYQFLALQFMIPNLNPNLHWILAFVFLLKEEVNAYAMHRLICTASGTNAENAKAVMSVQISAIYTMTVVVLISSSTPITSYAFLGVDFAMNLILTFRIIRLHKSVDVNRLEFQEVESKVKEMVAKLILGEAVEFLVPIAYMATFSIMYYGPNAEISGNIRNDYWQYTKVNDVLDYFTAALQMTFLDLTSIVISAILLWKFCAINMVQEFMSIIKRYGLLSMIFIALLLNKVTSFFK